MNKITKTNVQGPRKRPYSLLSLLAAIALSSLLLLLSTDNNDSLDPKSRRQLKLKSSDDPTSVISQSDSPEELKARRKNCQVVYLMGVEGATHHGFLPVVEALGRHQVDPSTDQYYEVNMKPTLLKSALFGWDRKRFEQWVIGEPDIDNDMVVRQVATMSCPDDGKKHVLVEWQSFPSGHEVDKRNYRVYRQHDWLSMTPEEIADSPEANQQPLNLTAFVEAYSPYMDIKFIVLHRPFLETIASHSIWDGGAEGHSNVIRAFMLILSRFLKAYPFDLVDGRKLWNLLCVEGIMAKNYDDENDVKVARGNVLANMAEFLGWPVKECEDCFDQWHESKKDPERILGERNVEILREHMELLEGVWPPPGEQGAMEQQRCGL